MKNQTLFPLFIACLLASFSASAQLGVSASFNNYELSGTENVLGPNLYEVDNAYEVGINYWYRLPGKRIEFLPRIYAGQVNFVNSQLDYRALGAEFGVQVYPFDFNEDCDCPTFGKQGPKLEKGFFVNLAPGYANYARTDELVRDTAEDLHRFTLTAGVGFDIGVSNLLTLTPYANYRWAGKLYDLQLTDQDGQTIGTVEGRMRGFQFGLRAGFRFDAKRY